MLRQVRLSAHLRYAALTVAIGLAVLTVEGSHANAAAGTRHLAGTFSVQLGGAVGCDPPSCATAMFNGSLRGPGESRDLVYNSLGSSTNYIFAAGHAVVRTSEGSLHMVVSAVFNPDPAGDGETSWLLKITGGTEALTGASGYIMANGLAESPGVQISNVHYTGKLVLP